MRGHGPERRYKAADLLGDTGEQLRLPQAGISQAACGGGGGGGGGPLSPAGGKEGLRGIPSVDSPGTNWNGALATGKPIGKRKTGLPKDVILCAFVEGTTPGYLSCQARRHIDEQTCSKPHGHMATMRPPPRSMNGRSCP